MGRQKGKQQPRAPKEERRRRGHVDHEVNSTQSMEWRTESFKIKQQLRRLGLQIRETTGDGNCLFRAVSDQMQGDESNHGQLRADTMRFIRENREDFEPFIEDDEPFDSYIRRMSANATWGGNMELQALSLLLEVNVSLHMAGMSSVWEIKNFDDRHRTIHLSYHLGEHYNSVRLVDDNDKAPARQVPSLFRPQVPKEVLDAEDRNEMIEYLKTLIPGSEEYKLQLVLTRLFGTETPSIDVINEKCGTITDLYFNSTDEDLAEKPKPPAEEEKKPQYTKPKRSETRPAVLPRNNEKCWCGSNKKYKSCCKAKDAFREVEPEATVESEISSLRI